VVTPTYATADEALAWLNRAQCIGVGRVDMRALEATSDIYVVQVGDRKRGSKGSFGPAALTPDKAKVMSAMVKR
jgi:hypothetical protein